MLELFMRRAASRKLSKTVRHLVTKFFGFSLIELLISMGIALGLTMAAVMSLNPRMLISRAQDGHRRSDMHRTKIALEEYFNDNSCYPDTLPFGQELLSNGVPIFNIPQDPIYPQQTYIYFSSANCSKWFALFYKEQASSSPLEVQAAGDTIPPGCSLPSTCLPANYSAKWGCLISGVVDCGVITTSRLPLPSLVVGATLPPATPTRIAPTATPTRAPTAAPTSIGATAPTATPASIGFTSPTPTSIGPTAPTAIPTSIGATAPTATPTLTPTPVGVGSTYSLMGTDGTWCILSSDFRIGSPPANSYCVDRSGRYYNYCNALVNKVKRYLCQATLTNAGYVQAHCHSSDYYCPASYECSTNSCQRTAD